MKKHFIHLLSALMIFAACGDDNSQKYGSTLEEKRRLLEEKKKELQDKKELAAVEAELKQLDQEIKGVKANGNAAAPKKGEGVVNGGSVSMRKEPSTQADKIGTFDKNEVVTVLEKRDVENEGDEGILNKNLEVGPGVSLVKGKAVNIERIDEASQKYYISFDYPEKGKLYANVDADAVDQILTATWYRVKKQDGKEGWIFGKFLTTN